MDALRALRGVFLLMLLRAPSRSFISTRSHDQVYEERRDITRD